MAYLDTYTTPLTAAAAAHLLRRATFGPTQQEIADFTGKTASQAVDILINNASYRATPPPPVEMDVTRSDAGQPFLGKAFASARNYVYYNYIKYWWIGLMSEQNGRPSVLEKLTAFWQNHFVVVYASVEDYRYMHGYLSLLRSNALGNFRDFAIRVTKDPGMLIFQNGNENSKERPNENYARELQELFTVGQRDFAGNHNYTEDDVRAAARVLTGWQTTNRLIEGSTSVQALFTANRHDESDKAFSDKYGNTVIRGKSGQTGAEEEISGLIQMLLSHPECPKYICRKLYRWYVNPNVTPQIESDVIVPLAAFFSSPGNNFEIAPIIKKLLSSNIFFDQGNLGAIIKSPAELMIGTVRMFDMTVPNYVTQYSAFLKMMSYLSESMSVQQLDFLNQPSVFGSPAYYQTGFSKNWINETTIGVRGKRTDPLVSSMIEMQSGVMMSIDILGRLRKIQPNFSDINSTPAITCEEVLGNFTNQLFAVPMTDQQRDFLIDSVMMMNSSPRSTWIKEWNAFRSSPDDVQKQNAILWRCRALLKYLFRMAEYQLF